MFQELKARLEELLKSGLITELEKLAHDEYVKILTEIEERVTALEKKVGL
jgi:hypothetical protein